MTSRNRRVIVMKTLAQTTAMKLVPSISTRPRRALRCVPLLVQVCAACSTSADLAEAPSDAAISPNSSDAAVNVGTRSDAAARSSDDAKAVFSLDGGALPPPPTVCTASASALLPRPAEGLLVLDRSTAMADLAASGTSKWAVAVSAVGQATSSGSTAWGLMLYPKADPSGGCCTMPTDDMAPGVEVTPDVLSSSSIDSALADAAPTGMGRPMARALVQAGNYLSTRGTSTSKYLILVAAAEPTCASDDLCSDIDDARSKDAVAHVASLLGIPVAVVAVALAPSANSMQTGQAQQFFTDLAKAGGMPNTTPNQPAYYAPASSSDLAAALASLASRMRSCSFALGNPANSTANAQVTLGDARIPRDVTHQNGWDFGDGDTSVVLYGKPCADARSSSTPTSIQFMTFCPEAVF